MATNRKERTLDDVLIEFMADDETPTSEALMSLARRYPQYRRELVDFAAAWAEQLTLPPEEHLSAEQEKSLVDRAMSHVGNVTFERNKQVHAAERGQSKA